MSVLKVTTVQDPSGVGGFTLNSGSITANGELKVTNLNINGSISGSSNYVTALHLVDMALIVVNNMQVASVVMDQVAP